MPTSVERDTIAAIATPPGVGGVGIVRLSGAQTPDIAQALLGLLPPARHAHYTSFRDAVGQALDMGLALYFPAPHSFTGEHVLEMHGHGGPVVLDRLMQRVIELGARPARPGEFSERAFLNGKIDLVQAEAIADLIESVSEEAARVALQSLQGKFSQRVHELVESLIQLRLHIEAALDFPEEQIDFLADPKLISQQEQLNAGLRQLLADSRQGQLLHDGMTVVLAGRPNAGKSSLLNLLARHDRAIVSAIPGTTRDILHERIQIDGLPLHILDTAGLRAAQDEIETEGVRRARDAMLHADRVLLLIDDTQTGAQEIPALLNELPAGVAVTIVRNKIDLSGRVAGLTEQGSHGVPEVALSAQTADGLPALHQHLKACMGYRAAGEGVFSARRRHLEAIQRASQALAQAGKELAAGHGELVAEHLRLAQQAFGEITGEFTSDDLLGRIFSAFCIGK